MNEEDRQPAAPIRKLSHRFSLAVCLLLLLAMCVFWVANSYHTRKLLQQQSDLLGQTLANQIATQLTELLLANDLISVNVVLAGLTRNSAIAEITVLGVDNSLIASSPAEADSVSPFLPPTASGTATSIVYPSRYPVEYRASIALDDTVIGVVQLRLNPDFLEAGMANYLLLVVGATCLLLIVAVVMTSTYFQFLVSFPASLLSHALGNIRKGEIATCPEPDTNNELSFVIRQYNATAEFLARNAFLDSLGNRLPISDQQSLQPDAEDQTHSLLIISLANYGFLASTMEEPAFVELLNRFYFFADKISGLYNGKVSYCTDGEVVINFPNASLEDEQAFLAVCAGQVFLHIVEAINDREGQAAVSESDPNFKSKTKPKTKVESKQSKYKLAVHSGQHVNNLYSPITGTLGNLTGKTLDQAREICRECPENALVMSEASYVYAGAQSRVEATEFADIGGSEVIRTYLNVGPMAAYRSLLERQASQLVTLYAD